MERTQQAVGKESAWKPWGGIQARRGARGRALSAGDTSVMTFNVELKLAPWMKPFLLL